VTGQEGPPAAPSGRQDREKPWAVMLVPVSEQDATAVLWCSKAFDHPDGRAPAAELLMTADDHGMWQVRPRCARHPAADDVTLLRKVSPLTACLIIKLAYAIDTLPDVELTDPIRLAAAQRIAGVN
jgi:hypothetical protein